MVEVESFNVDSGQNFPSPVRERRERLLRFAGI